MASATSTDDDALHETAAAPCGFASLPLDVISTHILRSDFLQEPRDLARVRAVSRGMRNAVDATGREIKKLSDEDAARLGYVSLLKERYSRGLLEHGCLECLVCAAAARNGDLPALKALRAESLPWNAGHVLGRGAERPPRGADLGARERLPVGRGDVCVRGEGRPHRDAEVGARERLPVVLYDVRGRGEGRPARGP
jgi:hypothetical protein